uniref:SecY-type transporter protein n=1 Tax=Harveyella mirabilis TaxID=282355 RepID=A0A3S8UVZ6_9FLOR|nr:SecY-type transporter protein [Harveyella mirabilis]
MEKNINLIKKIFITLIILIISRIGIFIPVLGINNKKLIININKNKIINFLDIFSGGGFSNIGIFSLGIIPYINSSIITRLILQIIPQLKEIEKNKENLKEEKINYITKSLTILWALIQSYAISLWIKPYTTSWNNTIKIELILTLVTGSMIIIWFSEMITKYGIGNGLSLLIFQNIIVNIPKNLKKYKIHNLKKIIIILFILLIYIIILMINILIQDSKRKIHILSITQLRKQKKIYVQNYIPLKLNQGGVMPIIFTSTIITLLKYVLYHAINNKNLCNKITKIILSNSFLYIAIYLIIIININYIYSFIIFNPKDISNNLQKISTHILGVQPGLKTNEYINNIIYKLTFIGSILLFVIAQSPLIIFKITQFKLLEELETTSLVILVRIIIDTAKQIQTCIISEQYDNMIM